MRPALAIAVLLAVGAEARADVSAPRKSTTPATAARWLTARDGLPAAVVAGGAIRGPREAVDCRWVTVGSRWRVVDRVGVTVGEARVTRLERGELWPCKMASFSGPRGRGRLLVERAAGPPVPTATWLPSDEDRAALARLVGGPSTDGDALFFSTAAGRFAVATHRTRAVVVRWERAGAWAVVWQERAAARPTEGGYERPAAIDLDGDGAPEVVVGWWRDTDYGDLVLQAAPDGSWRLVARSFEGNTI